jgi:periplasmic protein TonB
MTAVGMQLRYPQQASDAMLLAEDLAEIADRAQSFTGATGVVIALRRGNELVVRTSDGLAPDVGTRIPFPSGVTGLCVTTRKPQTCDSADIEAQIESPFRALQVQSILSVPVERNGEICGVLAVSSQMRSVFSRTHVAVLMTLSDVVSSKLDQYAMPMENSKKPASPAYIEIDAESLLKADPSEAVPCTTQPAAPVPAAVSVPPPAPPLPRVEAAPATPVARVELKPPVAVRSPLPPVAQRATFSESTDRPVTMNPDVLSPAENPIRHGSVIKPKAASIAAVRSFAKEPVVISLGGYAPYRAQKARRNYVPLLGGCAAVLVLALAIVFYPRIRTVPPVTIAAAGTQPSAAAEAPSLKAVPLKTSGPEQPSTTVPPDSAASATRSKEPAHAVEQRKPAVEALRETPPVMQLSAAPAKSKSEQAVESPALGLVAGSGKALPDLAVVAAPVASAPVHKQVTSVLMPAKRLKANPPQFPEEARRRGESGLVTLLISISADGKVTDARVVTGNLVFAPNSIAAVRQWVYSPARLDGRPVASTAEVSLRFNASAQ